MNSMDYVWFEIDKGGFEFIQKRRLMFAVFLADLIMIFFGYASVYGAIYSQSAWGVCRFLGLGEQFLPVVQFWVIVFQVSLCSFVAVSIVEFEWIIHEERIGSRFPASGFSVKAVPYFMCIYVVAVQIVLDFTSRYVLECDTWVKPAQFRLLILLHLVSIALYMCQCQFRYLMSDIVFKTLVYKGEDSEPGRQLVCAVRGMKIVFVNGSSQYIDIGKVKVHILLDNSLIMEQHGRTYARFFIENIKEITFLNTEEKELYRLLPGGNGWVVEKGELI